MEQTYRFPKEELLRYRHCEQLVSGENYILVMARVASPAERKPIDYALRAKISRDGVEAFPFCEENLRKKRNDKDLYWTVTDEGDGKVSLWSPTAKKYLVLEDQGASLKKKKQRLSLTENGSLLRFSVTDKKGNACFLRGSVRAEASSGVVFTSGEAKDATSFGLMKRVYGIPAKPAGDVKLTVGTFADIHVDYGMQLFRPYLRQSAVKTAKGYRKRYDLDAVILCGDSISDNGSSPNYPRGGAVQGKWPYDLWLKTRNRLHEALKESFRNPGNQQNIFHLAGNHEYQVGDRQPEGLKYNSAYYTDLLPEDLLHPLTEPIDVDQGADVNLMCYEYRVKDVPFLVLNTPVYPFKSDAPYYHRHNAAHTFAQALWLEERLKEIEETQGKNAVVFVTSHYPFVPNAYDKSTDGISNLDAFLKMEAAMNRFPNLFFFYGHVHGGNQHPTFCKTSENMSSNAPIEMKAEANEEGLLKLKTQAGADCGRFASELVLTSGYHHNYAGNMSFYKNTYFKNDGKKFQTGLSHLEVPFFQGCAIEVYEDRVILTMNNFGTKEGVATHLPGASYKLKPLVCLLEK